MLFKNKKSKKIADFQRVHIKRKKAIYNSFTLLHSALLYVAVSIYKPSSRKYWTFKAHNAHAHPYTHLIILLILAFVTLTL